MVEVRLLASDFGALTRNLFSRSSSGNNRRSSCLGLSVPFGIINDKLTAPSATPTHDSAQTHPAWQYLTNCCTTLGSERHGCWKRPFSTGITLVSKRSSIYRDS